MTKKKMAEAILSLMQTYEVDKTMFGHSIKEAHNEALDVAGLSEDQYKTLFDVIKGETK